MAFARCFIVIIILLHFDVVYSSPANPFNITARLSAANQAAIDQWVALGSRTRLNIRPTFSDKLGLPEEALCCCDPTSKLGL